MKKETGQWLLSWFYVGWFTFMILSTIRIYLIQGWGIDLQFTLAVDIIMGCLMAYGLIKLINKNEFRLKKPVGVV